jgi:hypothetical protein
MGKLPGGKEAEPAQIFRDVSFRTSAAGGNRDQLGVTDAPHDPSQGLNDGHHSRPLQET